MKGGEKARKGSGKVLGKGRVREMDGGKEEERRRKEEERRRKEGRRVGTYGQSRREKREKHQGESI